MKKQEKPWENQKNKKKQKKQYLETISRAPPPKESLNIGVFGFFVFFGFLKVFLVFSWSDPRRL